jgi:hypothetical protein
MKKINDLNPDEDLKGVAVRLPNSVYLASSLPMYGIKNKPVYLMGFIMGDFFVKTNPKSSKIYPMFWSSIPSDICEWDVVE